LPLSEANMIEIIARSYCDGYRAAKDPDTTHVIPDFLVEPEAEIGPRSSRYAFKAMDYYNVRGLLDREQLIVNERGLEELPRENRDEMPQLWKDIWAEAAKRSSDPIMQSAFNDGCHYIIERMKPTFQSVTLDPVMPKLAAYETLRHKGHLVEESGGWHDQKAFSEWNRLVTEVHRDLCHALAQIVGERLMNAVLCIEANGWSVVVHDDGGEIDTHTLGAKCKICGDDPNRFGSCGCVCDVPKQANDDLPQRIRTKIARLQGSMKAQQSVPSTDPQTQRMIINSYRVEIQDLRELLGEAAING